MIPSLFLCHCFSTSHPTTKSEVMFSPCLDLYASLLVAKREEQRERE